MFGIAQTDFLALGLGGFLRLGLGLGSHILLGEDPNLQQVRLDRIVELGLGHTEFLQLTADQLQLDGDVDLGLAVQQDHGDGPLNVRPGPVAIAQVFAALNAHRGQVGPLGGGGLGGQGLHHSLNVADAVPPRALPVKGLNVRLDHFGGIGQDGLVGQVLGDADVARRLAVGGVVVDAVLRGVVRHVLTEHLTGQGLVGVGIHGVGGVGLSHGQQVLVGPVEVRLHNAIGQDLHGQLIGTGEIGIGGGVHGISSLRHWRVGVWFPVPSGDIGRWACRPSRHNH